MRTTNPTVNEEKKNEEEEEEEGKRDVDTHTHYDRERTIHLCFN
jgi:hypothetical protein